MAEYTVTTYAELVEKAAESGSSVTLGRDIDVLTEYPNGDAPQLVINGTVNGDGHRINRLYRTGTNASVVINSAGYLENTDFTNITGSPTYGFVYATSNTDNKIVMSGCRFAGIVNTGFVLYIESNYRGSTASGCSFNISGSTVKLFYFEAGATFNDINAKLKTSAQYLFDHYYTNQTYIFNRCYLEIDALNLTSFDDEYAYTTYKFESCVLDITSENVITTGNSNSAVSIYNSDHAPNLTATANLKGVTTANWLDADYLESIGFNIVEVNE